MFSSSFTTSFGFLDEELSRYAEVFHLAIIIGGVSSKKAFDTASVEGIRTTDSNLRFHDFDSLGGEVEVITTDLASLSYSLSANFHRTPSLTSSLLVSSGLVLSSILDFFGGRRLRCNEIIYLFSRKIFFCSVFFLCLNFYSRVVFTSSRRSCNSSLLHFFHLVQEHLSSIRI